MGEGSQMASEGLSPTLKENNARHYQQSTASLVKYSYTCTVDITSLHTHACTHTLTLQ